MIKKNILVVDDSAVIRRYLIRLLEDAGYEVEIAKDGEDALRKLKKRKFSLVTLDFEMPYLNGLEVLKEIMQCCPTRVLMISSYTTDSAELTFKALELGAIDYIPKPRNSVDIAKVSDEILKKIKNSFLVPVKKLTKQTFSSYSDRICIDGSIEMGFVLIGASTGGPRLIEKICKALPVNYPHCICVVQHMPVDFTANFAKRLNSLSKVEVIEADEGIELQPSRVIIAKGGWHLHFKRKLTKYEIKLSPNVSKRFFVPSVDEMFFSAATVLPAEKIVAIELTGIGDDGADGMVELRKQGAFTIAESEITAVVYGMPKEAYERGGAQKVLDFDEIVKEIIKYGQ